jgi:hypothetical protein
MPATVEMIPARFILRIVLGDAPAIVVIVYCSAEAGIAVSKKRNSACLQVREFFLAHRFSSLEVRSKKEATLIKTFKRCLLPVVWSTPASANQHMAIAKRPLTKGPQFLRAFLYQVSDSVLYGFALYTRRGHLSRYRTRWATQNPLALKPSTLFHIF